MKSFSFFAAALSLPFFAIACSSAPGTSSTASADTNAGGEACQAASDCSGLLPHDCTVCADGTSQCSHWDCNQNQCEVALCGDNGGVGGGNTGSANQCQAASDCSGLLPHTCAVCADGTSQCSHWDCTQNQCEVALCGDNGGVGAVDAGSANQCQAASDCSGLLPQNCAVCADGTNQCSHWDCNQNQCQVTLCGDNGGVATVDAGASDAAPDCSVAVFQACNSPSDCSGNLPAGSTWGCTNQTALAQCNFAEPVCVVCDANGNCN